MDVIGFHPKRKGAGRVGVVSCKSWQAGFDPREKIAAIEGNKIRSGRFAWRAFREVLVKPKWADGLIAEVERLTGSTRFTYVTAVTKLRGDASLWEQNQRFRTNLRENPIKILTLQEMLSDLYSKTKTTMASSEVGRLLQGYQGLRLETLAQSVPISSTCNQLEINEYESGSGIGRLDAIEASTPGVVFLRVSNR